MCLALCLRPVSEVVAVLREEDVILDDVGVPGLVERRLASPLEAE